MKWYFEASKLKLNKIVIKIGCQHVLNMEICKQASMCAPLCLSARFLPMDAMACATVRSWNILGHLRRHGLAAQEVFARHARCNTWTPSTKCCCRSCSTDRSNGGRVSGCGEWVWLENFLTAAFLLGTEESHALYWNLHNENTWVFSFIFCFYCAETCGVAAELAGWSELFGIKNNGSRAACKTKSVLSFNYSRHKRLQQYEQREGGREVATRGGPCEYVQRGLNQEIVFSSRT